MWKHAAATFLSYFPFSFALAQGPEQRPFDPPNPCPPPPKLSAKNIGKFTGRWNEITPRGCADAFLPPRGVRVLFYFPTECVTPGRGCGYMVFGHYITGSLASGVRTEKSVYSSPSHWMLVAKPKFSN